MSTPKPLPEVPASPVLRSLTVESNALIRTLIQSMVDEEGLDSSWTSVIQGALVPFGEYVESGQWLPGLKRMRKAQNHTKALEEKNERERARKERDRLKEMKTGKSKGSDRLKENEVTESEAPPPRTEQATESLKFKEILALTSAPALPAPTLSPKHLLLTIAPHSDTLPELDVEFDIIPVSKGCSFRANTYSLPFFEDEEGKHGEGGTIICGLDSWNLDDREATPRIVGGTFNFRNITSATAYGSLTTVLRLSVYTYLSLILEQHLLSNSHVPLRYPTPPPPPPTLSPPPTPVPGSPQKRKARANKASSGIWSFLSKRTEGIIHRVGGASHENPDDVLPRTSSLDLSSVFSSSRASSRTSWRTRRASDDSARPVLDVPESESASNTVKASHARVAEAEERRDRERFGPFTSAVRRIQDQHCVLSTSPNVAFPLPPLVARLAQREAELEKQHTLHSSSSSSASSISSSTSSAATAIPGSASGPPNLRLTGVEKTGLGSVLGWEGREARGRGMAGVRSFVRHQGLTVLYAEHVVAGDSERQACGRSRWVTFRYWARAAAEDAERDRTLGEMVERVCEAAVGEEHCEREGCDKPRGKHSMSWTCGGVRIDGSVKENTDDVGDVADVTMWETCAVCGKSTERAAMDDGTYLFSFAKFLELLIWSPMLALSPLCEHTAVSPTPTGEPALPETRFHILRRFAHQGRVLTLALTAVHNDVYEIRVPKLQVIAGSAPKEEKQLSEARKKQEGEEERQALGAEIEGWWKGLKKRLDSLEEFLDKEAKEALYGKHLPPLPSSDDADLEDDTNPDQSRPPSPTRPQAPRSISLPLLAAVSRPPAQAIERPSTPRSKSSKPAAPYPPGLPLSIQQSRQLLGQLRLSFQRSEDALQKQVADTPVSSLNDVRRTFRSTARGAFKRLAAWQKKHAPGAPSEPHAADGAIHTEPEWWSGNCHAVPGGRVVVREREWGSVIAFTLSSLDYQRELANLKSAAPFPSSPAPSITTLAEPPAPIATIKALKPALLSPDPDETDAIFWEESEPWSAVITRREHPREASSLLSLRDVLRNKRSFDSSSLGSRFTGSVSRGIANFTPPSAWAPPQVQVNVEAADGQVSQFPEAAEAVEKLLESQHPAHHHAETTTSTDYPLSTAGTSTPTPSGFVEKNIRSGKASSIISFDDTDENDQSGQTTPPAVPPKSGSTLSNTTTGAGQSAELSTAASTSSFGGAISSAMRYFLSTGSPSRSSSPAPSAAHHGLLALETSTPINERPHIKYDWTIGKRIKFSCTVYYAKQFDVLRKKCGVADIVMKSLERSENWTAVGGKSKSNFWKSADDRFIIKTLVNAWNVADLQVLIELAPSYFRYIDSTASKASVLAKLMGFYTVEIKNLETGTVQAKHDLLVMENLFYNQKVLKTFDLKGIQSRRVKSNGDETEQRTLFDGEWIEGQQRAPLLIQPHSRAILQEAIKADADFLARSNIMDYSMLLGIDEDRHEIACGLVDTIGSYTFAKTLEYKAKQNLNSGKNKEVTVVPPGEYHSRFVSAMDGYFLACPDKWTKPLHYIDRTTPHDLASVI